MQDPSSQLFSIFPDFPYAEMVFVKGGTFMMGSDEEDAYGDEKPIHKVTVPDFWIGQYPVTQALWEKVMGVENNPSRFKGKNRPVEMVSWNDITQDFLPQLNAQTRKGFALPSEACWEYAAKGGRNSKGYRNPKDYKKYAGSNEINEVAWYDDNSHNETKAVGLKAPNELGLYDMSGNVLEWCQDHWHDDYTNAPTDGSVWEKDGGTSRVLRGGSWLSDARSCRTSSRSYFHPDNRYFDIGFRLFFY